MKHSCVVIRSYVGDDREHHVVASYLSAPSLLFTAISIVSMVSIILLTTVKCESVSYLLNDLLIAEPGRMVKSTVTSLPNIPLNTLTVSVTLPASSRTL